jgi:hypothetical protein
LSESLRSNESLSDRRVEVARNRLPFRDDGVPFARERRRRTPGLPPTPARVSHLMGVPTLEVAGFSSLKAEPMLATVPIGAILFGLCTLMAVAPFRRPRRLAVFSWISNLTFNELPFLQGLPESPTRRRPTL